MRRMWLKRLLISCSARQSLPKQSLLKRAPLTPLKTLRRILRRIAPTVQAWDAGYCDAKWPFPMARLPGGFYVNHYKVRACCCGNDSLRALPTLIFAISVECVPLAYPE